MTELTLTRVKKIQLLLFLIVIVMLFFGGCTGQEANGGVRPENMVSLSGGVDISTMGTEAWQESQALNRAEGMNGVGDANDTGNPDGMESEMELRMVLNPDETTVLYENVDFMSTCRSIGGDSIYSTGFQGAFDGDHPAEGPYFAGRIGMEESRIQQFSLDIPKDMLGYRGCIDNQGRWHLLLSQKADTSATGDGKTEIWIISRDGELEQSFDITECVREEGWFCLWMAVDNEGNYYLATNGSIRVIDAVNQTVKSLHFSGQINGIGMGRSGALYGVFDVEGTELLGIVDTDSGSIEKCAELPQNGVRPTFSALQAGADTELLLANMGDGIWSYDGTELRQELSLENIVTNGQDILAMGFLWDGRVCIMSYENGKYVFHYAPIEV